MRTYLLIGCVGFLFLLFGMQEKCDTRARIEPQTPIAIVGLIALWPLAIISVADKGLPACEVVTQKQD